MSEIVLYKARSVGRRPEVESLSGAAVGALVLVLALGTVEETWAVGQ